MKLSGWLKLILRIVKQNLLREVLHQALNLFSLKN